MTPLLVLLAIGPEAKGWIPIVVDQTTIRGTPTLMAGVRVANRVLPVAFACFEYEKLRKSQNAAEEGLLALIAASLPLDCKPLYVMDRSYARVISAEDVHRTDLPRLENPPRHSRLAAGSRHCLAPGKNADGSDRGVFPFSLDEFPAQINNRFRFAH